MAQLFKMMKELKDCQEMRDFAKNNFKKDHFDQYYMKSSVLKGADEKDREQCFGLLFAFGGMNKQEDGSPRTSYQIQDFSWRILANYCRFCYAPDATVSKKPEN